jgi:hypothetical protein
MGRLFVISMVLVCLAAGPVYAQEETDTDAAFMQMQQSLLDGGLTEIEVRNVEIPVKNMLYVGANAKNVENAVIGFKKMGLKGRVLSDSVFSMSYLVSVGDSVDDAKNVIEEAAREAMGKGIMGKNLAIEIEKRAKQRSRELWKNKE